jgi:hypothetical protein
MKEWPPRPKWRPELPIDIQRIAETFAYYFDQKKSFVLFRHGTCVVVPADVANVEPQAIEILTEVINNHVDMNPRKMDDGHWTVSYSRPVYSLVFADEVDADWQYIDRNHLNGLCEDEVLIGALGSNVFDHAGKIGLFGRARLFMDALNPEPVYLYRA